MQSYAYMCELFDHDFLSVDYWHTSVKIKMLNWKFKAVEAR